MEEKKRKRATKKSVVALANGKSLHPKIDLAESAVESESVIKFRSLMKDYKRK